MSMYKKQKETEEDYRYENRYSNRSGSGNGTNQRGGSKYWYSGRTCIGKTNWLNDKKWSLMIPELTQGGDLPAFSSKNLRNFPLFCKMLTASYEPLCGNPIFSAT